MRGAQSTAQLTRADRGGAAFDQWVLSNDEVPGDAVYSGVLPSLPRIFPKP